MRNKRGLGMGQFFILIVLLLLLFVGLYLFLSLNEQSVAYDEFFYSFMDENDSQIQFYPNMRYQSAQISYGIAEECSFSKREAAVNAFAFIADSSILSFEEVENGAEIDVLCSNIAPKPEQEDHFVAGEGGPASIVNSTAYSVILNGQVSLFRAEKCGLDKPQIATHEILHALGFDHNNNPESIMYAVSDCFQEIDDYIIEAIADLYEKPSRPDLAIESLVANREGRLLNFDIVIGNFGLVDSVESKLVIYADNEPIREFDLEGIDIGVRKSLSVENLRMPSGTDRVSFSVETDELEINKGNNAVEIIPEEE